MKLGLNKSNCDHPIAEFHAPRVKVDEEDATNLFDYFQSASSPVVSLMSFLAVEETALEVQKRQRKPSSYRPVLAVSTLHASPCLVVAKPSDRRLSRRRIARPLSRRTGSRAFSGRYRMGSRLVIGSQIMQPDNPLQHKSPTNQQHISI